MTHMADDAARLAQACMSMTETERADLLLRRTAALFEELEISLPVMIDRLLTQAAFASVTIQGSKATAEEFRLAADRIEAGLFAQATGEGPRH